MLNKNILSNFQNNFNEIYSPIFLLYTYNEVTEILKGIENEYTKFLYNRSLFINKILFNEDKTIDINKTPSQKEFSFYFYLYLLIIEDLSVINYSFKIELLENLNKYILKEKKEIKEKNQNYIKLLILSLLNLFFIDNYKELDEYDEKFDDDKLENYIEDSEKYIKDNLDKFNNEFSFQYNLETLIDKDLEELYVEIIIVFIKQKKFDNFEYIKNILEQLGLNDINFTKKMINKLNKFLEFDNINKDIEYYLISEPKDLENEYKINFFYFIIKYIFKSPDYIYKISLFIQTRKKILNFAKNKIFPSLQIKGGYIVKYFLDSEYFIKTSLTNENTIKFNILLNYLREFYGEDKKDEINEIKNIKKKNGELPEKYLNIYKKAKEINEKMPFINFYKKELSEKNNSHNINNAEILGKFETIEQLLIGKKINKMKKNDKLILINFLKVEENKTFFIKIYGQDIYEFFAKKVIK